VGQSPTAVAVACSSYDLDSDSIDRLTEFFRLLKRWKENSDAEKVM
jgi:hypothetical protein